MKKSETTSRKNSKTYDVKGRAIDVALPYRLKSLTYWHKGPLIPGARVLVPLKGKQKIGLLLGENKNPPASLKETFGLLDETPLVPQRLLSFLSWLSEFYLAPQGEVLKYGLPSSLFTFSKKRPPAPFNERVPQAEKRKRFKAHLYFSEDLKERSGFLKERVKEALTQGACLFLLPDRELLAFYAEGLKEFLPTIYTADLTPKKREEIWLRALKGEIKLVLGTRLALFLPLSNLSLIVLEEEEHHGYKQEEGFRANFRDLALMRAKIEEVPLILASGSPSVKTFYLAQKGRYELKEGVKFDHPLKLIDLKREKGFLSTRLLNALRKCLAENSQALLFLNRLGYAGHIFCESCGHLWLCPRCKRPLRLFKKEGLLRCPVCAYREKALPRCPVCGGEELKALGVGTEKIKEQLESLFEEARIALWGEEGYEEADFIIATAKVSRFPPLKRLSLVAAILADQLFFWPSYLASERAYQLLKKLALIAQANEKSLFLIQTYQPGHHVFAGLKFGYEVFLREELALRRAQKFPPFGRLAEILVYPQMVPLEEAASLVEGFLKGGLFEYFGPLVESLRGKERFSFLLRAENTKVLHQALSTLKDLLEEKFKGRLKIVIDMSPE